MVSESRALENGAPESRAPDTRRLEQRVARVLTIGSLAGVAALAVGVAAIALTGIDPLVGDPPTFDLARIPADVTALNAEGFIWLGLIVLIATPAARVLASLIGFATARDRAMTIVAAAILAVIALGVVASRAGA